MCMHMHLCTYDYQKDGALDTNLIYIYLIWFVVYMHVFRRTRFPEVANQKTITTEN